MTEELYLADDTVLRFDATVERALDDRVVLDRTHFYPTGGGQPHDTGVLHVADEAVTDGNDVTDGNEVADGNDDANGDLSDRRWRVVDVQKKDTVYHTLEPVGGGPSETDADSASEAVEPPEPGTAVVGEIDGVRRAAHSKYHTAQHLLSALLLTEFGARTTGNQLYHDHAHLDAAYDRFDADDLARIEEELNGLVADGRPVTSYAMARDEAEATLDTDRTRIDLLPDSIEELRIVEIGGSERAEETGSVGGADGGEPYDRTACAGTHVGNTSEIGEIVVTGRETKGSDEERVRFALADHVERRDG